MLWVHFRGQAATGLDLTGSLVAVTVLMACFALFMRLPPWVAVFAVAPFMVAAIGIVVLQAHSSSAVYTYSYLAILCNVYFFVAIIGFVTERLLRHAFINEQLLIQQNAALDYSRALIRRYVPRALADDIVTGKLVDESPERHRVTILFSDIVGFTEMADRFEAEVMSQVINEYMGAMAEIVDAQGGTVNEFMGDGLMALFGAPAVFPPQEQARNAIGAAQAMQRKLPELQREWRKLGLVAEMQIRIGINTGMASVGSYGSEGRMTYTAIGVQTNIAARLQAHCGPGKILISEATWQLIRDEIQCEPVGDVACKGLHFPVRAFSPCTP